MDQTNRQNAGTEVWLDEDQQRAWRGVTQLYMKLPAALESELQRTSGITIFEYEVMAVLSETDTRTLRMSELAAQTNSSLSRLSHVVSRLESRGWVTRRVCPNDGRATEATLTEPGFTKVVETAPDHVRAVRELVVEPISPAQFCQLGDAARRIGQRIDEWNTARAATTNKP